MQLLLLCNVNHYNLQHDSERLMSQQLYHFRSHINQMQFNQKQVLAINNQEVRDLMLEHLSIQKPRDFKNSITKTQWK